MSDERQLALIDVDNTLYEGYILFPLIDQLDQSGLLIPGAKQRVNSSLSLYRNGTFDYETFAELALVYWAAGLGGKNQQEVEDTNQKRCSFRVYTNLSSDCRGIWHSNSNI